MTAFSEPPELPPEPSALRQAGPGRLRLNARAMAALRGTAAPLRQHVASGRRGLAICGSASGAGVSTIAAALAVVLAQDGVRTLVLEANLRRPSISGLIPPMEPVESGLLQFLTGDVDDPTIIVQPDVLPNLSAIYAGGQQDDAADLFDTDRFELVMRYALRSYDLTLIDTPPANRCAETRRIAALAGYAAVAARRNVTMADDLGTLVADLRLDRVEVIGSIFNEG